MGRSDGGRNDAGIGGPAPSSPADSIKAVGRRRGSRVCDELLVGKAVDGPRDAAVRVSAHGTSLVDQPCGRNVHPTLRLPRPVRLGRRRQRRQPVRPAKREHAQQIEWFAFANYTHSFYLVYPQLQYALYLKDV